MYFLQLSNLKLLQIIACRIYISVYIFVVSVIEHKRIEQDDVLYQKDEQIKELSKQLKQNREEYDKELTDLNIRLQQDLYIARTMEEKDKRSGIRTKKGGV